jgi:ectoine hydroxylase-related dioxygenase (phytanoyl-CoA dioxygenase family)
MKTDAIAKRRSDRTWMTVESCKLDDFIKLIDRQTSLADYPLAGSVQSNVLIYEGGSVREAAKDADHRKAVMAEWAEALYSGPGIVVIRDAFPDKTVLDAATAEFNAMIREQHEANTGGGDHFAKPGANDRIWNALEKLCLRNPELFAKYYSNDVIALISEAWLGTAYQVTSQLNVVNPGGEAQSVHRDYHMGFQTAAEIERFPLHAHQLSPVLTLQGAIAHCDMPVESGPTLYLPYSQNFVPGFFAWRKPEFKEYFNGNYVQLPLAKGDAAFLSPALFHAAGHNRTTDIRRMANLLQVSSAYGRAMESMDRARMSAALYPALRKLKLGETAASNAIAACAEGYAFPTNLDRDPPIGGLAPQTQQQLMKKALAENWEPKTFSEALDKHSWRRLT